jgi:hypothetical protein
MSERRDRRPTGWKGRHEVTDGAISTAAEVVDSEGERLGSVIAAAPDYIVAEHGFFFPTDFYIPRSAIAEVTESLVRLALTKDDVLTQGWDVRPDTTASPKTTETK